MSVKSAQYFASFLLEQVYGFFAARRNHAIEAALIEGGLDQNLNLRIVFDDQNHRATVHQTILHTQFQIQRPLRWAPPPFSSTSNRLV
jgi:hypothetical protein